MDKDKCFSDSRWVGGSFDYITTVTTFMLVRATWSSQRHSYFHVVLVMGDHRAAAHGALGTKPYYTPIKGPFTTGQC